MVPSELNAHVASVPDLTEPQKRSVPGGNHGAPATRAENRGVPQREAANDDLHISRQRSPLDDAADAAFRG